MPQRRSQDSSIEHPGVMTDPLQLRRVYPLGFVKYNIAVRRHQQIFVRVVESGSFLAVARAWRTGQPAISKPRSQRSKNISVHSLLACAPPAGLSLTEAWARLYEICRATHQRSRSSGIPRRFGTGLAVWRGARHRRARLLSPLCRAETTFVPRALSQRRRQDAGLQADEQSRRRRHRSLPPFRNGALADSSLHRAQDRRVRRRCRRIRESIWNAEESPRASAISTVMTA